MEHPHRTGPPLAGWLPGLVLAASLGAGEAGGPVRLEAVAGEHPPLSLLRVHPQNPRLFADAEGKAVYLAGAHIWQNLQDFGLGFPPPGSCGDHACGAEEWDYLRRRGLNFTRGWLWEHAEGMTGPGTDRWVVQPAPFLRDGGKYALDAYDPEFFARLEQRVEQAAEAGLYVSIMLFQGFSVQVRTPGGANPWRGHPFHPRNTDSLDGRDVDDPRWNPGADGDGGGEELHTLGVPPRVRAFQDAYVEKMVAELNPYDNILWEICNECGDAVHPQRPAADFIAWMHHVAALVRSLEGTERYPKRHLIWISAPYGSDPGVNPSLLGGPADVVALRGGRRTETFHSDPPQYDGDKIALIDSDHLHNPHCIDFPSGQDGWCGVDWPWKMLTRGYHPVLMDTVRTLSPANDWRPTGAPAAEKGRVEDTRRGLGQTARYANRVVRDLAALAPRQDLSQTAYCLADPGREYLVFQPGAGRFWVRLETGEYRYQWLDTATGTIVEPGSLKVAAPGRRAFAPGAPRRVLHLWSALPDESESPPPLDRGKGAQAGLSRPPAPADPAVPRRPRN